MLHADMLRIDLRPVEIVGKHLPESHLPVEATSAYAWITDVKCIYIWFQIFKNRSLLMSYEKETYEFSWKNSTFF